MKKENDVVECSWCGRLAKGNGTIGFEKGAVYPLCQYCSEAIEHRLCAKAEDKGFDTQI